MGVIFRSTITEKAIWGLYVNCIESRSKKFKLWWIQQKCYRENKHNFGSGYQQLHEIFHCWVIYCRSTNKWSHNVSHSIRCAFRVHWRNIDQYWKIQSIDYLSESISKEIFTKIAIHENWIDVIDTPKNKTTSHCFQVNWYVRHWHIAFTLKS